MAETTSEELKFVENSNQIFNRIIEERTTVLRDIIRGPEDDRESRVQSQLFEFFDEDLRNSRLDLQSKCHPRRNIYVLYMILMRELPDKKKPAGKLLYQWYLTKFIKWLEESNEEEEIRSELLTEKTIKRVVRVLVKEGKVPESVHIRRIFDISDREVRKTLEKTIDEHLDQQKFKEAADLIIKHKIPDKYLFEDLVLPLIVQDKVQVVTEMMKISKRIQKEYVTFLDQFVGEMDEVVDLYFKKFVDNGMLNINLTKFRGKNLLSLMHKFFLGPVKEFNFELTEEKDAPRYTENKKGRALKYYAMQRYVEKICSDSTYYVNVNLLLRQCSTITIKRYLDFLWDRWILDRSHDDNDVLVDAIFWTTHLMLPSSALPMNLRNFLDNPDYRLLNQAKRLSRSRLLLEDERREAIPLVVELEDKTIPIKIIRENDQLEELCMELENVENGVYIGYDSEFKQISSTERTSRLSIIQLYFHETVWIIDVQELEYQGPRVFVETWKSLYDSLFQSEKLKIIIFDARNDIQTLFTVPQIRDVHSIEDIKNVVCLKKFVEDICEIDMSILDLPKKNNKFSVITETLFGIELDKREQIGNWSVRPLRNQQIVYAAKDAVMVTETFEKVVELIKLKAENLDFEKLIDETTSTLTVKKEKSKKDPKGITKIPWSEVYERLHDHRDLSKPLQKPFEVKIITDLMIQGLGRNLTFLGVDVFRTNDQNELTRYIEEMMLLELEEQRYVVVSAPSRSYDILKQCYPDLKYIEFYETNKKQPMDLVMEFFDVFNIDIPAENGFIN